MKLLTYSIIVLLALGCKKPTGINLHEKEYDTIKPRHKIQNAFLKKMANQYHKEAGFIISDYYTVIDNTFIDADVNGIKDTLLTLSPIGLLPNDSLPGFIQDENNRLLVIKTDKNYFFENVIANEWGMAATGSELIEGTSTGFKLTNHLGQACFFDYEINIQFISDNFYITSIEMRSGCPGEKEKNKRHVYKNRSFPLSDYKRGLIDSLRVSDDL